MTMDQPLRDFSHPLHFKQFVFLHSHDIAAQVSPDPAHPTGSPCPAQHEAVKKKKGIAERDAKEIPLQPHASLHG
jgi:hypothetical protein